MKNGFTLVELLSVIVILAVIALITAPIVLSIINDTKESALIKSTEMYISAIENSILRKNFSSLNVFMPQECIVNEDGNVTCDGTYLEIEVNGDKPDSGFITYDNGKVVGVELSFGDRKVITNTNGELVLEGNLQICKLISGEVNEIGSKYECEVKSGTKYNFYVLSHEEDGTTNLIMERNICEDGTVATEENKCTVAWTSWEYLEEHAPQEDLDVYENLNKYGPVTAMNYLNNATSDWNNIPNLNLTYNDEGENFTGFAITGKARLPYHREVNAAGCVDDAPLTCPLWMADYLTDAGPNFETTYQENPIDGIWGYWTLSSSADVSSNAWFVYYIGNVYYNHVDTDSDFGARPVINVKL